MTLTDVISKRTVYGKNAIIDGDIKSKNRSIINGENSEFKFLALRTTDLNRWHVGSDNITETGANAGSNFFINRFDDTGAFLDHAINITRSNGNVGIGLSGASEKLDVNGKIKSKNESIVNGATSEFKFTSLRTNNLTRWDIGSDNIAETGANAGSDFFIHNFSDSGTFLSRAMHITRATGYVGFGTFPTHPLQMASGAHVTVGGTWTNASDKKLKENISYEYPYGLEQILGLKPAKFDFIKGEKNTIGFIAQDVKEQLPEAISSTKNADDEEIMGINSTAIIATLVKAVQQLSSKVDELTQKVQILETNNSPEPTQP